MIRLAVAGLVLLIGGTVAGYGLIRNYLHSDGFRTLLSNQVSEALEVEGAFGPLSWDGLAARTPKFEGVGDGPLLAIQANDVRTEIGLGGLRDGYWLLQGSSVRRLEVEYDARADDEAEFEPELEVSPPSPPPAEPVEVEREKRGWLPSELRYDAVDVTDFSARVVLDDGELHLKNHRVRLREVRGGDAQDLEAHGGTITTPLEWLPELRLEELAGRYRDDSFFLTGARFGVFERGVIDAAGEWDGESGGYAFQGSVSGVRCSDLLDEDWSRRLSGQVVADYVVRDDGEGPRAHGTLEIRDGVLTALPLLDSLTAYADTRRFRELTLHDASCRWEWHDGRLALRDLRFGSEGLARLEGGLTIGENGELDGAFRLGLAPGTLSRIPGAETVVFRQGEEGLLWVSFRVTGDLENPREDLTSRLIAAAGERMFEVLPETGERVLRHTRTLISDLPRDSFEQARRVIDDTADTGRRILREAGGVIEGLFGGGERREDASD